MLPGRRWNNMLCRKSAAAEKEQSDIYIYIFFEGGKQKT
jgi:hypothetical protein